MGSPGLAPGVHVWFSRVPWCYLGGGARRHRPTPTEVAGQIITGPEGGYCVLRVMHAHVPPYRSRLIRCRVDNLRPRDEADPIDAVLAEERAHAEVR